MRQSQLSFLHIYTIVSNQAVANKVREVCRTRSGEMAADAHREAPVLEDRLPDYRWSDPSGCPIDLTRRQSVRVGDLNGR